MAEKKEKDLNVYFPKENCDNNLKKIAVKVLDYYIEKIEKDIAPIL